MSEQRFLFVDGLRGIAALSVALFHIGRDYLELEFLSYGSLGVIVFFVLSGYVISHSLVDRVIDGRFFAVFAIKRSIRLDPAYWAAIILAILVIWLPSLIFNFEIELPSLTDVLIHMFYLQDLAQIDPINVVFWTLCYEIQFYLVFCGLLYFSRKISHSSSIQINSIWLFTPLFAISMLWPLGILEQLTPGLFINLWYLFLLGVFARWAAESKVASIALFTAVLVLLFAGNSEFYSQLLTGALTALLLFAAMHFGKMRRWLTWAWIQYLGKISYSLYLVHDIVGLYVRDTGLHLTSKYFGISSLWNNYVWCLMALIASILGAHLLFRYIEQPSHMLSRKVDVDTLKVMSNKLFRT